MNTTKQTTDPHQSMTTTSTSPGRHPQQTDDRREVLGYPVDLLSMEGALNRAKNAIEAEKPLQVVTLNPEMIAVAEADSGLEYNLKMAGLVLPDGAGIVWALKTLYGQTVDRVPGIEFSEGL
ncbi:MAG: hypothetical protein KTR14_06420, partial [Vampirovibrio sp.]|nr:hypothetical protein [Vampirovibrio sp.]